MGHYKSERGDSGMAARAVALRDHNSYSVILGVFHNEGYDQTVTLAQVFWLKDADFVRDHMLEAFPVEARIAALISHFDDLNRAHEAVLKAKLQIEQLTPLSADCDRYQMLQRQVEQLRGCRDMLRPWFAHLKGHLLEKRIDLLQSDLDNLADRLARVPEEKRGQAQRRDERTHAIAANGGNRIEQIKADIARLQDIKDERARRARRDRRRRLPARAGPAVPRPYCRTGLAAPAPLEHSKPDARRARHAVRGSAHCARQPAVRRRIDPGARRWTNQAKIAALAKQERDLTTRVQAHSTHIQQMKGEVTGQNGRLGNWQQLAMFGNFNELDWRPLLLTIDVLRTLQQQFAELSAAQAATESEWAAANAAYAKMGEKFEQATLTLAGCAAMQNATSQEERTYYFPRLESLRAQALGQYTLSVESCDNREKDFRDFLQTHIDSEDKKIARLRHSIIGAMQNYTRAWPLDSREVGVSIDAGGEFKKMLVVLAADDLPRFAVRFKELLNENTIREIAGFQSQLKRERKTIRERIATINGSLRAIDYNPNRYSALEARKQSGRRPARLPAGPAHLHGRRADRIGRRRVFGGEVLAGEAHHRTLPRPRRQRRDGPSLDQQGHRRAQLVRVLRIRTLARG
jgi:uncharacterized protein YPO0396